MDWIGKHTAILLALVISACQSDRPHLWVDDVEEAILGAQIVSRNNCNDQFYVTIDAALVDVPTTGSKLILQVGNRSFSMPGVNQSGERRSVGFMADAETAWWLAKPLRITPRLRRHPGHELVATFSCPPEFEAGMAEFIVDFTIENCGDVAIDYLDGGRNRNKLGRDNRFNLEVERDGQTVELETLHDFGGLGFYRTLDPGDSYTHRIDLCHWLDLDTPGVYQVRGVYTMNLMPGRFDHRARKAYPNGADLAWDEQLSDTFGFRLH